MIYKLRVDSTVNECMIDELSVKELIFYDFMYNKSIDNKSIANASRVNESTVNDLTIRDNCLLIMDVNSFHCPVKFFQCAEEYNIILVCLPL